MLKSMSNSVWEWVLFLEMKFRILGILHQMNLILVTLIFILDSLAFEPYRQVSIYLFSGGIHVQRTSSSYCPIFFRVSWLYDPFPYPTSCLSFYFSSNNLIYIFWYFGETHHPCKLPPLVPHTHTHHICYLSGISQRLILNILQTLNITENASTQFYRVPLVSHYDTVCSAMLLGMQLNMSMKLKNQYLFWMRLQLIVEYRHTSQIWNAIATTPLSLVCKGMD